MTRPGRTPRLMKLTTRMIAIACHSDVMNSEMAPSDRHRLIGDQLRLDADRQIGGDLAMAFLMFLPKREDVAAVAHGDRKADRRLAVDAEHRLRRIGEARAGPGRCR